MKKKMTILFILILLLSTNFISFLVFSPKFESNNKTAININEVIKNDSLGTIFASNSDKPTADIIKKQLVENKDDHDVVPQMISVNSITNDSATIIGKQEKNNFNFYYSGKAKVNFQFKNITDFRKILQKTNLGTVIKNQETNLTNEISKLILTYNPVLKFANFKIETLLANSAVVTGIDDLYHHYQNSVIVTFNVVEEKKLSDIINNSDLGEINIGFKNLPSENEIFNAILLKNHYLDLEESQLIIEKITNEHAVVKSDNPLFLGSVLVYFQIKKIVSIHDVLTETNLHTICLNNQDLPTAEVIKTKIKQYNQKVDLDTIEVLNITKNNALIIGIDNKKISFKGEVEINYQVKNSQDIENIITKKNLGQINLLVNENLTSSILIKWLIIFNPDLLLGHFSISKLTNNSALVTGDSIYYFGSISIIFSIRQNANLNNFLLEPHLGSIYVGRNLIPTTAIISKAIASYNQNNKLDMNEIIINNINANSAIITGKSYYLGFVTVDFKIRHFEAAKQNFNFYNLSRFIVDQNNVVYCSTKNNIYCLDKNNNWNTIFTTFDNEQKICNFCFDQSNNMYVLMLEPNSNNFALYKSDNQNAPKKIFNFSPMTSVLAMLSDQNKVYLSCGQTIIEISNNQISTSYFLNGATAYSIVITPDHRILAGTNNGVYLQEQNSHFFHRINFSNHIGIGYVSQIVFDHKNNYYFLSNNYHKVLCSNFLSNTCDEIATLPFAINDVLITSDNSLLLLTDQGLYQQINGSCMLNNEVKQSLLTGIVTPNDDLYLSTKNNCIYYSENKSYF